MPIQRKILALNPKMILLSLLMLAFLFLPALSVYGQSPPVIPNPPRPDGSVVHVVLFGDTFDAILIAYQREYGVELADILAANGWRFPPDFIFVDQEIIIIPAGTIAIGADPAQAPPADAQTGESEAPAVESELETSDEGEAAPPSAPVVTETESQAAPFTPRSLPLSEILALTPLEAIPPFLEQDLVNTPPPSAESESAPLAAVEPESASETIPNEEAEASNEASSDEAEAETTLPNALAEAPTGAASQVEVAPTPEAESPSTETESEGQTAAIEAPSSESESQGQTTAIEAPSTETGSESETESSVEIRSTPLLVNAASEGAPDLAATQGTICALIYADLNQNARYENDEPLLSGGAISFGRRDSQLIDDAAPLCQSEIDPGLVLVSAAPPAEHGFTTARAFEVQVVAGRTTEVRFGALEGLEPPASEPPTLSDETLAAPIPDAMLRARPAASTESQDSNALSRLLDYSAYIALVVAGLIFLIGSLGLLAWLRGGR